MSLVVIIIITVLVLVLGAAFLMKPQPDGAQTEKKSNLSIDVVRKSSKDYELVRIYFSSQTGTAEKFSETISEELHELGIPSKIINLQDFNAEEFKESKFSIWICATHYEGDAPDNAVDFDKDYMKASDDDLSHMKYIVYALGDKTYKNFAQFGKDVDAFLTKRGAQNIYELGVGSDHANAIEDQFNEWKKGLWEKIISEMPLENEDVDQSHQSPAKKMQQIQIQYADGPEHKWLVDFTQGRLSVSSEFYDREKPDPASYELNTGKIVSAISARVVDAYDVRQENDVSGNLTTGRTIHMDLELPRNYQQSQNAEYQTAANLIMCPENKDSDIQRMLRIIGKNGDEVFKISLNKKFEGEGTVKLPIPTPISVRDLLRFYVDMTGPLKVSVLKKMMK